MSHASPPPQDIAELLSWGRILAVVPRDQQKILEQPDSWAVDLKNAPHGVANVPGHVVETAMRAFKARRDREPSPSRSDSPDGAERSNHDGCDAERTPPQPDSPPSSSPERMIEWPESPDRQFQQQGPVAPSVEQPVVHETPKPAVMAPPPLLKPQLMEAPIFADALQTSDEEDAEQELPPAQAQRDVPVNTAAAGGSSRMDSPQAVETPPCAQPRGTILRDTVAKRASSPARPAQGRRRRHKPIELTSSPIKPVIPAVTSRRMPSTKTFVNCPSSSLHTSSSSMVPATDSSRESVMVSVEHSIENSADPGDAEEEDSQDDIDMDNVIEAAQQDHAGTPPIAVNQSAAASNTNAAATLTVENPAPNPPASMKSRAPQNPYEAFAAAYPDYITTYRGSLWSFVRACVCIEVFQKGRSLRQCLFDDFIRAFSGQYLVYVTNAGPGQEPLPALEWFNNLPDLPVYNQMVITSANLEYILSCFPNEVGRARQIFRGPDSLDDEAQQEQEAQTKVAQSKPTLHQQKLRSRSPILDSEGGMDVDSPEAANPEATTTASEALAGTPMAAAVSPEALPPSKPQTPRSIYPRLRKEQLPLQPSPELIPASSAPAATPTASAPSRYLERLASRKGLPKQRSEEEKARLRAHIRRRQASRGLSSSSSKAR